MSQRQVISTDKAPQAIGPYSQAIRLGAPLTPDGEEGMAVQKIIDGLYRSAEKNGVEVPIK